MTARGIRNNNPGNIRRGERWQGLAAEQPDPSFCTFVSMAYGCRALIKTLQTYVRKRGCKTVRQIIERWAPPTENNTESYVRHVASAVSRGADEVLPFDVDPSYYLAIARAIARHENGSDAEQISSDTWEEAAKMAGL